jgi:hypothetical protein
LTLADSRREVCWEISDPLDYLSSVDIEVVFVNAIRGLSCEYCEGECGSDDREKSEEKSAIYG